MSGWERLIDAFVYHGTDILAAHIKEIPARRRAERGETEDVPMATPTLDSIPRYRVVDDTTARPVGAGGDRGCVGCEPHKSTSLALGHVESIIAMSGIRGEIPDVMRGEVGLTDDALGQARRSVDRVVERVPSLAEQGEACKASIDAARACMPDRTTMTVGDVRKVAAAISDAHIEATKLSVGFFEAARDGVPAQRIDDVFDAVRRGKLTNDQAWDRMREVMGDE